MIDELHKIGFIDIPGNGGDQITHLLNGTLWNREEAWGFSDYIACYPTKNIQWCAIIQHPLRRLMTLAVDWFNEHQKHLFKDTDPKAHPLKPNIFRYILDQAKLVKGDADNLEDVVNFKYRPQELYFTPDDPVHILRWERLAKDWKAWMEKRPNSLRVSDKIEQPTTLGFTFSLFEKIPNTLALAVNVTAPDLRRFNYRVGVPSMETWKLITKHLPKRLHDLVVYRPDGILFASIPASGR